MTMGNFPHLVGNMIYIYIYTYIYIYIYIYVNSYINIIFVVSACKRPFDQLLNGLLSSRRIGRGVPMVETSARWS